MAMLQRIMKEDPAHLHWLWQRHFKGTGLLKLDDIEEIIYKILFVHGQNNTKLPLELGQCCKE